MIVFDDYKLIENMKKNGIAANDKTGNFKLKLIMQYFMTETKYSPRGIMNQIKRIAQDYYRGIPDAVTEKNLEEIRQNVLAKELVISDKKTITLYESEMKVIAGIEDENMQRMLFSALICFKHKSQHEQDGETKYFYSVQEDFKADIFRYADIPNVSGVNRNAMLNKLSEMGLLKVFMQTNKNYKWNQTAWISMVRITVPFCVDILPDKTKEKKWMDITNYEDIQLYLRLYKNDPQVTTCKNCGCPIIRERAKQFCGDCATLLKRENDRQRYQKNLAFA